GPGRSAAAAPSASYGFYGHRVIRRDVLDHLETEARHARDALGTREHAHLADVEVFQDLRADAVQARIPWACGAAALAVGILEALEDLRSRVVPAQQDDHAFLVVRHHAHRVLHGEGVARG